MGGRYDLTDFEWTVIEPLLPNKPRGVPRLDGRRVWNGIFWVSCERGRRGAICRSATDPTPPATTVSIAGARPASEIGVMDAITEAYDGDIQMIDSSVVRVH